jgi:hypothetical protein
LEVPIGVNVVVLSVTGRVPVRPGPTLTQVDEPNVSPAGPLTTAVTWKPRVAVPSVLTALTVYVTESPAATGFGFWLALLIVTVPTFADATGAVISTRIRLARMEVAAPLVRDPLWLNGIGPISLWFGPGRQVTL